MSGVRSLTGKSTIVGLIGWPVSHSVSPPMHNAAFAALGLDWHYVPLPVAPTTPTRVAEAVLGLRALGLVGANVTVPHKQAVLPLLDRLTPAAQTIGAVNTIRVEEDGLLLGDNTDAAGLIADLRDHGVDPAGAQVLMLGAGGSARAVLFGLASAGAAGVTVLNRTLAHSRALVAAFAPAFPHCKLVAGRLPDDLATYAGQSDLVINTTSLGMTPHVDTSPWESAVPFAARQVVYDLVYNPPETRLMAAAAAQGAAAINGLGMLVWQGALSFRLWTGRTPPVDVMRAAALEAFGRRF